MARTQVAVLRVLALLGVLLLPASLPVCAATTDFESQLQHIMAAKESYSARRREKAVSSGATAEHMPPLPPSSLVAQIRAAAEAQALLKGIEEPAKEQDALANVLKGLPQGPVPDLPKGVRAWCPALGQLAPAASSAKQPNPFALASAVNAVHSTAGERGGGMSWDAAMADELASIGVGGVWWSAKKRPVDVTLITQASVDRLPQLHSQCRTWRGPLSAVLFLGLLQPGGGPLSQENQARVKNAAGHVVKFFVELENDDAACQLDVMLVYEVFTEAKAMMLYPINALRNIARLQARTALIALVDVDMLMGRRFYQDLRSNPLFARQLVETARAKTAFVLPAFETYGKVYEAAALADLLSSRDKAFLWDSVTKGMAGPFDHARFAQGHNWTLFDHWKDAEQAYKVDYGPRYEPWTVVDRMSAPWHDTRFRGYGQNKIVHIAHMNSSGYSFVVLSNAFIIHRAHEQTTMRLMLVAGKTVYDASLATNQAVDPTSIYAHTKSLFDGACAQMADGTFDPVLDRATLNGRATLSWWKEQTRR